MSTLLGLTCSVQRGKSTPLLRKHLSASVSCNCLVLYIVFTAFETCRSTVRKPLPSLRFGSYGHLLRPVDVGRIIAYSGKALPIWKSRVVSNALQRIYLDTLKELSNYVRLLYARNTVRFEQSLSTFFLSSTCKHARNTKRNKTHRIRLLCLDKIKMHRKL
jgi:hypothetical protein